MPSTLGDIAVEPSGCSCTLTVQLDKVAEAFGGMPASWVTEETQQSSSQARHHPNRPEPCPWLCQGFYSCIQEMFTECLLNSRGQCFVQHSLLVSEEK